MLLTSQAASPPGTLIHKKQTEAAINMYEGLEFTRMVRWEEHQQKLSLNQALQLLAHATLSKSCQF